MIGGINTNVSYKGETFHIQTEDGGEKNPVITTLLYKGGAIIASKKTNYSHLLKEHISREGIKELIKKQHKEMIIELFSGKYDNAIMSISGGGSGKKDEVAVKEVMAESSHDRLEKEGDVKEKKGYSHKTLDDILLEYIMKRKK